MVRARYVSDISIFKRKGVCFAPFLRMRKDAGGAFKVMLLPVAHRTLSFLASAHAPVRVTSAVMTPTLSSGTCPHLHLLPLTLAPDFCRGPLPASASFHPPERTERRGHAFCSKSFQSLHCSSGGITPHPTSAPTHRPPPRAPTRLAALTSSAALTHQPHSSPPQACHSCNPLPRRFGPKIFTSSSLITWG